VTALRPRLAAASIGDPYDPRTQSGVAKRLLDALGSRSDLVRRVDSTLTPWQRGVVAAASFRPERDRWRRHIHRSPLAAGFRTPNVERALSDISDDLDALVLVRGMYRPFGLRYVPYIDNSAVLTLEQWPQWAPWTGGFRDRVVATERAYLRDATHVFATGRRLAESIVSAHDVSPDRITVVGGGSHFAPVDSDPGDREPMILFVGYDFRRKGGDLLVRAFREVRARVPGSRLVIVGPTVTVREPGVECLGPVSDRARIADLFRRASAFALPARYEPYGMVLLEAMAHGVPCVGTDVGAIAEIVDDGVSGRVVPPDDVMALGDALTTILTSPDLVAAYGEAGRQIVRDRLNWAAVADRIVDRLAMELHA
jgi:glycosyltransferase involved in cell wall biosynthesis